jgi:tetratricopeptide (TPR) repeat protein
LKVLAVLFACLILAAVAQAIVPDVIRSTRRLMQPGPSTTLASASSVQPEAPASTGRPVEPGKIAAADSQISPPRRRTVARPVPPVAVPDEGLATRVEPIDSPVIANAVDMAIPQPPLPAIPIDDDSNRMLETAANLVSESWQDFAYPSPFTAGSARSRMLYANHRNLLLKAIQAKPTSIGLEMVRKDYAAAKAQFEEDPRLDYAFGLVLWKHGQFEEAIDMFQTASRMDGVPFLPAALAVAWGRFLNHDERRGLDQLQHVARRLSAMDDSYPTEAQKIQAATSIGRALGYLSQQDHPSELKEYVRLTSINILKKLPEELCQACDVGQLQTGQRQSELLMLMDVSHDQIHSEHQHLAADLQARMRMLRTELSDARNAVTRNHRTHVEQVADVLKEALDVRAQMDKLQPAIKQLQDAALKLNTPTPNIAIKTMPQHYHETIGRNGQPQLVQNNARMMVNLQETSSDRAKRIAQLAKVRDELKKIDEELSKLRDQQQDLVAKRRDEDRQHAAGNEDARAQRVARLKQQRELEHKLHTLNKSLRRTMALREGYETIAAYIPWDIEVEGEALWLALNPKPADRTPAK